MPNLVAADFWVIAAYFVLTFGVGVFALRRKHETKEDYFLSGRSLPWHLAGLSMVATTFAADTPLAVTGITIERGIAGNFLWLSLIPSGILTAIFYARLWRRSGVMTDAEFATLRYSGRPAIFLRRFRALYLAIPVNLIIMGWVTTGMAKVMQVLFQFPTWQTLGLLYAFTVLYIVLSGLWGVVITDVLQFLIAITACIVLAVIATGQVGGLEQLWQNAEKTLKPGATAIYPWYYAGPVYVVVVWLGAQWWASWYPGFEPGGGGYVAQRLLSTRNENHAVAAALLFNVLHFVVRPWPWIITALAAAVALPQGSDKELLYPQAILAWMPAGLKGLMVAAFLAAFMSTIATHLNWGASYILNDVIAGTRLAPRDQRGEMLLSRLTIIVLAVAAIGVSFLMDSVSAGWELILSISAGTGPVYLLRWYWKRVNAFSEISAMAGAFGFSLLLSRFEIPQEIRLCLVALLTSISWVLVTLFTPAEGDEKLAAFESLVSPRRWTMRELVVFAAAVGVIYTAFFLIGEMLRLNWYAAALNALGLAASLAVTYAALRRRVS
ncbi:MAG: sodium:solute symporter family protein [Spirochaetota bacterium]